MDLKQQTAINGLIMLSHQVRNMVKCLKLVEDSFNAMALSGIHAQANSLPTAEKLFEAASADLIASEELANMEPMLHDLYCKILDKSESLFSE